MYRNKECKTCGGTGRLYHGPTRTDATVNEIRCPECLALEKELLLDEKLKRKRFKTPIIGWVVIQEVLVDRVYIRTEPLEKFDDDVLPLKSGQKIIGVIPAVPNTYSLYSIPTDIEREIMDDEGMCDEHEGYQVGE